MQGGNCRSSQTDRYLLPPCSFGSLAIIPPASPRSFLDHTVKCRFIFRIEWCERFRFAMQIDHRLVERAVADCAERILATRNLVHLFIEHLVTQDNALVACLQVLILSIRDRPL